jgi:WD40 repeat protein
MTKFFTSRFFYISFFVFIFSTDVFSSEPAIWTVDTRAEVLRGDARGVSVTDTGAITLAPRLNRVFDTSQSYVWSSAVDAAGNVYLGTGNDGRIFKVDASGKGALFTDLAELDVSALAIGRSGEIYAGTSPDGKVYRIDSTGKAEVFFDPGDKYIWSLAVLNDGSLAVGTGENGKIYRVRTANAAPDASLLFDTSETHIISLAADRQGNLYAGTDANGLVIRFGADGKPFALLDSPLREIHDLAIGADGSVYALALSDSASTQRQTPTTVTGQTSDGATVTATVVSTETAQTEMPAKSRYDLTTAKSAVYRILPDGGNDVIWSSANVTGFSVYAHQTGNGVLIGTADKGRIYSVTNDGRETLVLQSGEGQISTIKSDGRRIFATSSNQGRLYSFGSETVAEGAYDSSVRDARAVALWGRIWWRASGSVAIQTRTGNTEKPDETWSDWSAATTDARGAQITSPRARFMQWRAVLRGAGVLNEVNVSYLARNIAPEILSIQVLPTNVGLAPNPPIPVDPNIEASGLDPQIFGVVVQPVPPRRIYQRGARALQWTAEDRNGDRLEYAVYYREAGEANFKLLKDGLRDNFYTLDGLALADGRYIFRVVANDSPSNPNGLSLSGERLTEAIEIDNSAPTVTVIGAPQISGDRARIVFEAVDAASFINRAEFSVDGGEWRVVYADDGISDGGRERYTVEVPLRTGEFSVTLRVFDASGNVGNARAVVKR